jgi:hypothetical protein
VHPSRKEAVVHGGGANDLLKSFESADTAVAKDRVLRIGFFGIMGADEVFPTSRSQAAQSAGEVSYRPLILGDRVRDFTLTAFDQTFFPYDDNHELRALGDFPIAARRLWPYRTSLGNRTTFARNTYFEEGRPWYAWHQLPKDTEAHEWSIVFAEVATHNHFVLVRGGALFMQSAPIAKLHAGASEDDHLELLGVLNSSAVCFWLKQVAQKKGGDADTPWLRTYSFNSTNVGRVPIPSKLHLCRPRALDVLSRQLDATIPATVVEAWLEEPQHIR